LVGGDGKGLKRKPPSNQAQMADGGIRSKKGERNHVPHVICSFKPNAKFTINSGKMRRE